MYINDMEYPNQILDAIRNDSLVVFAGAGASAGAPTNLPDFEKLAIQLSEGSSYTKSKTESCEVFLGLLKANHIDVNTQAAAILSEACLKHNKLHDAIINLFIASDKIRIVTTNYDKMFEQALDEKGVQYNVYNAPALPLGNDVSGIVHIHGNVNTPKYMVVTDDDFGKAYLTDGYVSRFLTALFDSYTVLFIGYSYNDTILRYLTRAMSREQLQKRYILTDNRKVNWDNYGITPVFFPKRKYTAIQESLEKVGIRAKRSLSEWKECLSLISSAPPMDLSSDSEIDYCLENEERVQVLANIIYGEKWADKLDKKNQFCNLFCANSTLTKIDNIWITWFCQKVIGHEDTIFRKLFYKYQESINLLFAKAIIRSMNEKTIPDECFQEYLVLLEKYIDDSHEIWRLINSAKDRGLISICQNLYKKLWTIHFVYDNRYWISSDLSLKHTFLGEQYIISSAWDCCQFSNSVSSAKDCLCFYKMKLEELHIKYREAGLADEKREPWHLAMLEIEDGNEVYQENELYCLIEQMEELCHTVANSDPVFLSKFLTDGIETESILGKRIYLKLIRETDVLNNDDSFYLMRDQHLLGDMACKEEVFLLIKKIFPGLSIDNQNQLIDYIESIDISHSEYEKYNWCIWLQQCSDNVRINSIINDILSRNDFTPRERPEKSIYISSGGWTSEKSPISYDCLCQMDMNKAIKILQDYSENGFDGPSRWGLLDVFSKVISDNLNWAQSIPLAFDQRDDIKQDLWDHYFQGAYSSSFSLEDSISLIDLLSSLKIASLYTKQIAEMVWKIVQRDDYKESYSLWDEKLWQVIVSLWDKQEMDVPNNVKLVDLSFNTTIGLLLFSTIYLVSYDSRGIIDEKYKAFMEKTISLGGLKKEIALCILVGHFNFFYNRDKEWCREQFVDVLKGKNKTSFVAAWEGMVYFSSRLNLDMADVMSEIYFAAIQHISWLTGDARSGLIELYLTLLIYVIKDPVVKYIPAFYQASSQEDKVAFLNSIAHRLRAMDDAAQQNWWNEWLKKFTINISKNKPSMPSDNELKEIYEWIPETKSLYGEIIDILVNTKKPKTIDSLLFFEIKEKKCHIIYPQKTALLITSLINANTEIHGTEADIAVIAKEMSGLSANEQKDFQEALLKRNIQV